MSHQFLPIIFLSIILLANCSPSSNQSKRIDALAQEALMAGKLPGLAIMVIEDGKKIISKTYGKRAIDHDSLTKIDDKWHLGSDTKAMTAFVIAMGIEKNHLNYTTPISKFFKIKFHPMNLNLTVADLLSHSSGLQDLHEIENGKLFQRLSQSSKTLTKQRHQAAIEILARKPHTDPKGPQEPLRSFKYANINYIILGSLLEKIYNKSWEQIITTQLFTPLKMTSCSFGVTGEPDEKEPSQPWPHTLEKNKLVSIPPKYKADNPPLLGPAGTVHCNLNDWNKFISELIQTWNHQGQLLKDQNIAKKYFSNKKESPYTYGGWGRNDEKLKTPIFQHSGSNTLNYATAFFAPEKKTVILLATNSGQTSAEKAILSLNKSILKLTSLK